jgi:monoamine oxidase
MAHTPLFRAFIRVLRRAQALNLKSSGVELQSAARSMRSPWTRRRLIKFAALAGSSALMTGLSSQMQRTWGQSAPQIVIIGAGLAGLNAAYQLKQVGLISTVYEARNRVGGRILSRTGPVGEGVLDLGGSFINTDHADMLSLIEEFGLTLFNRLEDAERFPFPETGYFFDGRVRSEAEVADRLRPLARQIFNDATLLDENFDEVAELLDPISVADYLDTHATKILEPYIRELVENTIRTEYGVEPDESSALQLLFNLPLVERDQVKVLGTSDETFFVQEGSGRITESLAQALSGQIQLQKRLTGVQSNGRGFRLTFVDGSVVNADYVIIAIPFTVLRTVNLQVSLPETLRQFINEADLGENEKLFAGFDERIWRQPDGFVVESWTDLGFSQIWDETQRQPSREDGALTFYFGEDEVKALQSGNAETQGRRVIEQLTKYLPEARSAANGQFLLTDWTNDPLARGSYTNFRPGQYLEFSEFLYIESDDPEEGQDVAVGNLVFAGEHLSDEFYGYMNGAAQTGRLAAEVVFRAIQGK